MTAIPVERKQPYFQERAFERRENGGIRQARLNGKRRAIVGSDHAPHSSVSHRDAINVLIVKTIHQQTAAIRRVLPNFLHESAVVEAVDLLEFPWCVRLLKDQCAWHLQYSIQSLLAFDAA
jgi:hypothetical protein